MAVFGPHWWFFMCAILDIAAGVASFRRWFHGKAAGHRQEWQWSRVFVGVCAPCAGWDCLKVFMGGFWQNVLDPPIFAYSIYILVPIHLVLVPLLCWPNTEYEIAARAWKASEDGEPKVADTGGDKAFRWVTIAVSTVMAILGWMNTVARWRATARQGGMDRVQRVFGNIVEWDLASTEVAHEMGMFVFEPEIFGAFAFGLWSVVAGALIWRSTGRKEYFILTFIALVGQGIGGPPQIRQFLQFESGDLFKYLSNFFEPVSFFAMVYADTVFCEAHLRAPLTRNSDPDIVEIN